MLPCFAEVLRGADIGVAEEGFEREVKEGDDGFAAGPEV